MFILLALSLLVPLFQLKPIYIYCVVNYMSKIIDTMRKRKSLFPNVHMERNFVKSCTLECAE